MSTITREDILAALTRIKDAATGQDVVSAGMISGIVIRDGKIGFAVEIGPAGKDSGEVLRLQCENAVRQLPGAAKVTAVLTAHGDGGHVRMPKEQRDTPMSGSAARPSAVYQTQPLEHVRQIIAIASGKGGVGKSTTTVNLAHALTALGKKVGILDADIYGPSIPRMMGLTGKPEVVNGQLLPLENYGVKSLSMGFIAGDEAPVIWRGPMITKALQQMLRVARWGTQDEPLDVLLVDMPPGTGDIQLSMAQQVPINGAIIVTTPQDVAVLDARKCLRTFQRLNVPITGVIENMSGFTDPVSGQTIAIFGEGGGKRMAQEEHVPYLGEIPIEITIRENADKGSAPSGAAFAAYEAIATRLAI